MMLQQEGEHPERRRNLRMAGAIYFFTVIVCLSAFVLAFDYVILSPRTKQILHNGNTTLKSASISFPVQKCARNSTHLQSSEFRSLPKMKSPAVCMVDEASKLLLMGSSKGGATVTAQLMLRKLGLLETALEYNPWVHEYRHRVFKKQPGHIFRGCWKQCSRQQGWVCAKFVRSPLDRVVSSYIYIMKHLPRVARAFGELHSVVGSKTGVDNATFGEFVQALERRAVTKRKSWADDHFMPQSDKTCDNETDIFLLPVEILEESLTALEATTGIALNATGLTSSHYVPKTADSTHDELLVKDASNDPPPSNLMKRKVVSYDAYLVNPDIRMRVCQLYANDIKLYGQACSSQWLQQLGSSTSALLIRSHCERERQRVLSVCGSDFDFFCRNN